MEVLLYLGLPTKNEHDNFSCPQKFIAYPQPHEILKCPFFYAGMKKILKKVIKNIDIEIDTWYINTALFGRREAEIFEN